MNLSKHKPVSVGEMINEEFLIPLQLERQQLAQAMGISQEQVDALCDNQHAVDAETALILAKVFGNTAQFWLNTQQRNDLWNALHTPACVEHIQQAKPLINIAA